MVSHKTSPAPEVTDSVTDSVCAAGLALVVFVTYSVCLTSTYAHSDDYWAIWQRLEEGSFPEVFISAGRSVNALLFTLAWWPVQSVGQLWIPRCFSLAGLVLLVVLVFWSLRKLGYGRYFALLCSALVGFLPSFTVYVAWAIACSSTYAAIATIGAFWAIERAIRKPLLREWLPQAALGILLFVLGINTYQPTAMFYFTMLMFLLLSPEFERRDVGLLRRIGFHVVAIILSMGVSFLLLRLFQSWFAGSVQRASLDLGFTDKISWFLSEPFGESFLLLFLGHEAQLTATAKQEMAFLMLPVLALGLYLFLPKNGKGRIWRVLGALSLLPFTYLPNLVVQERFASYRTRGAIAAAVAFLVLAAAAGVLSRVPWNRTVARGAQLGGLLVIAVLGLVTVQHHVMAYFVIPSQVEWRIVRYHLAAALVSHRKPPQEVLYLLPEQRLPIPYSWSYDEFGSLSVSRPWVPRAICGLIVREIAPQLLGAYERAKFVIIPPNEPVREPRQDQWLVDAKMLNYLSDRVFLAPLRPGTSANGDASKR